MRRLILGILCFFVSLSVVAQTPTQQPAPPAAQDGRRETNTIDVGVMGNDQPLTAMHETWHSQALAINLISIRSGPMSGKQNFTITELSAVEPDPELFKVPEGFEVRDMRKSPPILW